MSTKKNTTKKVMLGISSIAIATAMTGCGQTTSFAKPAKPTDSSCKQWDWSSEDDVYKCSDSSSPRFGSFYHNNAFFPTRSALQSNSAYSSYKSNITSSKANSGITSGKTSSGFGKGSSVSGG